MKSLVFYLYCLEESTLSWLWWNVFWRNESSLKTGLWGTKENIFLLRLTVLRILHLINFNAIPDPDPESALGKMEMDPCHEYFFTIYKYFELKKNFQIIFLLFFVAKTNLFAFFKVIFCPVELDPQIHIFLRIRIWI